MHGPRVERDQPQSGLVRLPPLPKAQLGGERGNPRRRWAYRPTLGRAPSLPLWPPPRWDLGAAATPGEGTLEGAQPSPSPIYIGGFWSSPTHENFSLLGQPCLSSSFSSPVVLGEALLDCHAPPSPPHRCAAVGWSLPQPLPLSLLDQGVGDVTGLYVC